MKNTIFSILFLLTVSVFAHFPIYVETKPENGFFSAVWTPFQFGILPCEKLQIFHDNTDTAFSFGLAGINQKSAIISAAPVNALTNNYFLQAGLLMAATSKNHGFSFGLFNMSGRNYGFQIGLFNLESNFGSRSEEEQKGLPGLQIGLFNASGGFQIGLINFNEDGLIPFFPLINFPAKYYHKKFILRK